jgi:hypothetical protein
MGKQHETLPNEPQEKPVPKEVPEITRPLDPQAPTIPREGDEPIPNELPPPKSPQEDPQINPNKI